ncbi:MAG: lipid A export permease/ATP-binding protein MsbA [Pseudomonadota bacterium]
MSTPNADDKEGLLAYRRLLRYVFPYKYQFTVAVVGMVLYGLTFAAFAAWLEPLLDSGFSDRTSNAAIYAPLSILVIFFFRGLGSFLSMYYMAYIGGQVVNKLRSEVFSKYLQLPSTHYDHSSSGEMISLVSYNTQQVSKAASNAITVLIRDSIAVFGLLGLMFYHSWQLSISLLVLAPIVASIVYYVSKRFRRISKKLQASMGKVSHIIEEAVESHREIKIYGGQNYEQAQFEDTNERNRKQRLKMTATRASSVPIMQFIIAIFMAGIVYVCTQSDWINPITPGQFVSFITAMMMLFAPIKQLTNVNEKLQQGIAASISIFSLLDTPSESDRGDTKIDLPISSIDFDNVSFAYAEEADPVLRNVSLTIKSGETVALVGKSGSGKTTLANLLARMYQLGDNSACSGSISINGKNIESISLENMRANIAYVGQQVTLFNDTISHNIAYGSLHSHTQDDVRGAATLAHAATFIEKLSNGYDTMVGENGVLLSGGQRQRLAIARALLKNAPLLILDEATSALDTESERMVQRGLERLLEGRTTLVVAHRLSTIEHADKIVVMHQGEIVEQGSHKELLKAGGHYANLHAMQFKETATESNDHA